MSINVLIANTWTYTHLVHNIHSFIKTANYIDTNITAVCIVYKLNGNMAQQKDDIKRCAAQYHLKHSRHHDARNDTAMYSLSASVSENEQS